MVDQLDIPAPFDVHELCRDVARRRQRPIHVLPAAFPPGGPSGLCISMSRTDYIVHELRTTPVHQEHIILHEIGHLLWEHQTESVVDDDLRRLLLPDLAPEAIKKMIGRHGHTGLQERQAELVAAIILQRVARRSLRPAPGAVTRQVDAVVRMQHTLERTNEGAARG